MHGYLPSAELVPFPLQPGRPITEDVDLVEEQDRATMALRNRFGAGPYAVPEPRKGSLRPVAGSIKTRLASLSFQIQEQRGLAHLARSRQQLDPCRVSFGKALPEQFPAVPVVHGSRLYSNNYSSMSFSPPRLLPGRPATATDVRGTARRRLTTALLRTSRLPATVFSVPDSPHAH